jgi:DNA invertase Pin-like site-specific DNA recombinase
LIKTEPYKNAGQRVEARRLREVGLNWNDVATKLGISLSTVKRLLKLDVVDPVQFPYTRATPILI